MRTERAQNALVAAILAAGFACAATPAWGGGLYIQEFGTPSQGMVNAGANAFGEDASAALYNPASTTRLDDHRLLVGAGLLVGDIKFDASRSTPFPTGDGGQQGGPAPVLSTYYVHRLFDRDEERWFDRVRLGFALLSLSGAVLDPDDDWAGRFEVQKLGLITLSALPSVAVRVHDTFSVGVGGNLMYGRMSYDLGIPLPGPGEGRVEMEGIDDFEPGLTVSALWEPTPRTRVGMIWIQELDLDLDGDIDFKGLGASANIVTQIPFAQLIHVGLVHEFTPRLALGATFRWEDWSSLEDQFVTVAGFKTALDRGWDDTFGGSLGLRYQLNDRWILRGGLGYDSSPVSKSDRTADVPVDRQIRVGIGAQYAWREHTTLAASFSYANLGPAKIRSETLRGRYQSNNLFSLAVSVSFDRLPWSALEREGSP
jgi:long-chain fatty acid transport protein